MGGMVGQWLGANAPDRIEKLVLSNTNYHYADKTVWNYRITLVSEKGLGELVGPKLIERVDLRVDVRHAGIMARGGAAPPAKPPRSAVSPSSTRPTDLCAGAAT